jgi:hypothetical protein
MKTNLDEHAKARLGVLWVLLNISIDYKHDPKKVLEISKAIEDSYPDAPEMWGQSFKITVGKTVYEFNNGEIKYAKMG